MRITTQLAWIFVAGDTRGFHQAEPLLKEPASALVASIVKPDGVQEVRIGLPM